MDSHPIPPLAQQGHLALTRDELSAWGERLGRALQPPTVLALEGDLGAGKTTLVRAICRGYGVSDDVTSPTFTLVHEYSAPRSRVFHLDLYRLKSDAELDGLGFDEILAERAIVLIEWADRAVGRLPSGHIPIELDHVPGDPDRRVLYAGGHT
jgi:tRNA threonylcarbamoyl adenosine modification protein YjeE